MRNLTIALTLAALNLAAPAAAQDGSESSAQRTPENAQTFLTKVAEQYSISLRPESFGYSSLTDWYLGYKPVRIAAQDRCITRIEGDVDQFRAKDSSGELVNPGLDHAGVSNC